MYYHVGTPVYISIHPTTSQANDDYVSEEYKNQCRYIEFHVCVPFSKELGDVGNVNRTVAEMRSVQHGRIAMDN